MICDLRFVIHHSIAISPESLCDYHTNCDIRRQVKFRQYGNPLDRRRIMIKHCKKWVYMDSHEFDSVIPAKAGIQVC
jgi:hypothetical protein